MALPWQNYHIHELLDQVAGYDKIGKEFSLWAIQDNAEGASGGTFSFFSREDETTHTFSCFVYFILCVGGQLRSVKSVPLPQTACWTHLVEECLLGLLIYKRTVTTAKYSMNLT